MRGVAHEFPKVWLFSSVPEIAESFNSDIQTILLRYLKQSATVFAAE